MRYVKHTLIREIFKKRHLKTKNTKRHSKRLPSGGDNFSARGAAKEVEVGGEIVFSTGNPLATEACQEMTILANI